jgi:hypothetical protein
VRGFEAPSLVRGDNILIDGIRLTYLNVTSALSPPTIPFGSLPGLVTSPILGAQPSQFTAAMVGGIAGEVDTRFFPFAGSVPVTPNSLTATDVNTIITHAAQQANITRAAIRQPLGSNARVTMAVVNANGAVLGVFRQSDARYSVSMCQCESAFGGIPVAAECRGLTDPAGVRFVCKPCLRGQRAIERRHCLTFRAVGFLHRPFFPDGINSTLPARSARRRQWSVFNLGLQLDLIKTNLQAVLGGASCPHLGRDFERAADLRGQCPLYRTEARGASESVVMESSGRHHFRHGQPAAPPVGMRHRSVLWPACACHLLSFRAAQTFDPVVSSTSLR